MILIEASPSGGTVVDYRRSNSACKEEASVRFYTNQHRHCCGIYLHARMMCVCVCKENTELPSFTDEAVLSVRFPVLTQD